MNEQIFEGNLLGNEGGEATPTEGDPNEKEPISKPEAEDTSSDEESSNEDVIELLTHIKEMMSDSDDDHDDMGSNEYHNKAVRLSRCGRNREASL